MNTSSKIRGALANLLALGFGLVIVVVSLFATETLLRFKYDDPAKGYYSFSPKLLNHVALFRRSLVPKTTDPPPRVFCVGGSTTNGNNMPIERSYPNILGYLFKYHGKRGSAYNFGISGVNSVTTNFFIKKIIPRYEPQCIIIHDGYNDLPIVIKKIGEDRYTYVRPDYYNPFNPYIHNPVLRYIVSFIKFNLRSTRRFVVTFVKEVLHRGGDLFLGFDYKKYKLIEGAPEDIFTENNARLKIFLRAEIDSIEYCLKHGIKVIVILEPYIKPLHYHPFFGTGFRDKNVGQILSECHKIQQAQYAIVLYSRYKDEKDVKILDMRQVFKGRYKELFYDECHLNGKGNTMKAALVYRALEDFFPDAIAAIK